MDNEVNPYDFIDVMFGDDELKVRPYDFEMDHDEGVPIRAIKWHTTCPKCSQLIDITGDTNNQLLSYDGVFYSYCENCEYGFNTYHDIVISDESYDEEQYKQVVEEIEYAEEVSKEVNEVEVEFEYNFEEVLNMNEINSDLTAILNGYKEVPEDNSTKKDPEPDEESEPDEKELADLLNEAIVMDDDGE